MPSEQTINNESEKNEIKGFALPIIREKLPQLNS